MGKGIAVRVYGRRILRIESNSRGGREILDEEFLSRSTPFFRVRQRRQLRERGWKSGARRV